MPDILEQFDLTGQTAVVTGGTSGIGLAIAKALSAAGADVIPTSRTEARVEEAAQAVGCDLVQPTDVSDRDDVATLFDSVVKEHGSLNILINSAGIFYGERPIHEITDSEWYPLLDTNLYGVFVASQVGATHMTDGNRAIINISSIAAEIPLFGQSAYIASKFGVNGLTKSFAAELAPEGIRVNAVEPGYVKTTQNAEALEDERVREHVEGRTPLGRYVKPEEVAAATLYLASPAAAIVTGETLAVDGGITLGAFRRDG